jgi:8-oxo-dGTP diphosphatase
MPKSFTYRYPRPMVTVDLVVFGLSSAGLKTLLIRRKNAPYAGKLAIPGGYLNLEETFAAGARRELREETGIADLALLAEIGTFGAIDRDPRGRTISLAHAGIARFPIPNVKGQDDAESAGWYDLADAFDLAFDHDQILTRSREWLVAKSNRKHVLQAILPDTFDQSLWELALAGIWRSRRGFAEMIAPDAGVPGRFRLAARPE